MRQAVASCRIIASHHRAATILSPIAAVHSRRVRSGARQHGRLQVENDYERRVCNNATGFVTTIDPQLASWPNSTAATSAFGKLIVLVPAHAATSSAAAPASRPGRALSF